MDAYSLMSKEDWQKQLDSIATITGMAAGIADCENKILQTAGERNDLCLRIRNDEKSLPFICGQTQASMANEAKEARAPVTDVCEAGMAKFVIPLFMDDKWLGSLTACGSLRPGDEIEDFAIQNVIKFADGEFDTLCKVVPSVDEEKLDSLVETLNKKFNG